MGIRLRGKVVLIINVYPYSSVSERLKLTKELVGRIIIEAEYILNIVYEGDLQ